MNKETAEIIEEETAFDEWTSHAEDAEMPEPCESHILVTVNGIAKFIICERIATAVLDGDTLCHEHYVKALQVR